MHRLKISETFIHILFLFDIFLANICLTARENYGPPMGLLCDLIQIVLVSSLDYRISYETNSYGIVNAFTDLGDEHIGKFLNVFPWCREKTGKYNILFLN